MWENVYPERLSSTWEFSYGFQKKITKLQRPFSRGGPNKGIPAMTTRTITARRKEDPQHVLREKYLKSVEINQKSIQK